MAKHFKGGFEGKRGLSVEVRGGNVDGAFKMLNRRVKQEGLMRELRARTYFEKKSDKNRRKAAEGVSRAQKLNARRPD